jgi:hypothetical protein
MRRNNDGEGNRDEAPTSNINKSQEKTKENRKDLMNLRGVANKKCLKVLPFPYI